MSEVTIIGIDLATRVFQLHGARADGSVVFRKKFSRGQALPEELDAVHLGFSAASAVVPAPSSPDRSTHAF